jgi:hypothetical protein
MTTWIILGLLDLIGLYAIFSITAGEETADGGGRLERHRCPA